LDHRLKSKILIDQTFHQGTSVFVYPLKLVYIWSNNTKEDNGYSYGLSVSKRNLKRAVDRNLVKRRIREAVRKHIELSPVLIPSATLVCMLIYVSKEPLPFSVIENSIKRILKKIKKNS